MTKSFFIAGTPAPGGSKSAYVARKKDGSIVFGKGGRPVVNVTDDAGKRNKDWKEVVAWEARRLWGLPPITGACRVSFTFFIRRPNSHFRGSAREVLRPDAPLYHIQKPDALKFARSTEDALTGICYADDSLTIHLTSHKRWCAPGEKSGCIVEITTL